jgi:Tfp pilus assembly protein PilF
MMSWLPLYDMPASAFKSIIGTLMEVFPYVTIWYPAAHPAPLVLIVGSERQQYFSPWHIEVELRKTGVGRSLAEMDIHNSVHVLSCYVGDQEDLREAVAGYLTNSDYWPYVEFTTDGMTPINEIFVDFVVNVREDSIHRHIDWSGFSEAEQERWLENYRQIYEASSHLIKSKCTAVKVEKLKHCLEGLRILPDHPALFKSKAEVEGQLYGDGIKMVESGDASEALDLAGEVLKIDPRSAMGWSIISHAKQAQGDLPGALAAAEQAVDTAPGETQVRFNMGLVLFRMGQYDKALAEFQEMWRRAEESGDVSDHKRAEMLEPVAAVYAAAGRFDEAIATAEKALGFALASGDQKMIEHMRWRLRSLRAERAGQGGR